MISVTADPRALSDGDLMTTTTTPKPARPAARAPERDTRYQSGFANEFATEALPGALPVGQNSPQRCPYGLYAEQISGTAFTAPRHANRRTWFYRIRPGALHKPFKRIDNGLLTSDFGASVATPNQLRWDPLPIPAKPTDFVEGLVTMAGNGGPEAQSGCGIHIYAANRSMTERFFTDADGELLIVPQQGGLRLATEMGVLEVEPQEIAVVPRGVRFRVELIDGPARGYVCENFGAPFKLPDLGVDRLERPRQPARLPDACGLVRGSGGQVRAGRQVHGQPLVGRARPLAARRRRLARQLRALQVRPAPLQHDRLDRATTTPIRRSSSCCSRRPTRRAWT